MIRAWFSFVFAIFLLRNRNLEKISTLLRKRKSLCKEKLSYGEAELIFDKIEKTKKYFLSRTACLEQSLALFLFATSKKKSVNWCVGVRIAPFASHAWVEVKNEPVKEPEEVKRFKKVIVV